MNPLTTQPPHHVVVAAHAAAHHVGVSEFWVVVLIALAAILLFSLAVLAFGIERARRRVSNVHAGEASEHSEGRLTHLKGITCKSFWQFTAS